jgi:hypothetical protein
MTLLPLAVTPLVTPICTKVTKGIKAMPVWPTGNVLLTAPRLLQVVELLLVMMTTCP